MTARGPSRNRGGALVRSTEKLEITGVKLVVLEADRCLETPTNLAVLGFLQILCYHTFIDLL